MSKLPAIVLPGLLWACLLGGCGGGPAFTRPNFDTLYRGQPQQAVLATLGEPAVKADDHWDYVNRTPYHYEARLWFQDGCVVRKQWYDQKTLFKEP